MATTFTLKGEVDINASAAQAAVQALAQNFTKLSQNSRTSTTTLAKLAPILTEATKAADIERKSLAALAKEQENVNKVRRESLAATRLTNAKTGAVNSGAADKSLIADAEATKILSRATEENNKVKEQANKIKRESIALEGLTNARTASVNQAAQDKSAIAAAQTLLVENRALTETVRQRMLMQDTASKVASRAAATEVAQGRLALAQQAAQTAAQRELNAARDASKLGLSGMQFGLMNVSMTAALAGAALMGVATAGYGIGIAWQKSFAEVIRTSGALDQSGKAAAMTIAGLESQFSELVTTLPVAYSELAQIGTLAGQLGIQTGNIGKFTEIVAKFSATTDVSTEAAATAFGRLSAIIPDVKGNYLGLADAILKVGVHSVATESSIINISTQISSVAAQAGFGYKQIVGLSGALASIGVPPELSRGTMTRVFGDISRAISMGGTQLEKFAQVAGMSGEGFKAAWSKDASGTFMKFMEGIKNSGGDAESVIRSLGITSVRDVPILMRLANANDAAGKAGGLLAQTMRDAADAGGTLQKQYQVISGTVGAKLTVMFNGLQNAINTITSTQLGGLGGMLDDITHNIQVFTDALSQNVRVLDTWDLPFTNAEALGVGLGITAIVGALGLLVAVLGRVASGGFALARVWKTVSGHFAASAASTEASTGALIANAGAARANATATATMSAEQVWNATVTKEATAAKEAQRVANIALGNSFLAANGNLVKLNSGMGATSSIALGAAGAFKNTGGAAVTAALSYGGLSSAFGKGVPIVQKATQVLGSMADGMTKLATAMGPELLLVGGLVFSQAVLGWEADARKLGSSADDIALAFTHAKTSADLLGSVTTNRGGWISGFLGDTSQVKPWLKNVGELGDALDTLKGKGAWADANNIFMDMFRADKNANFSNTVSGLNKLNDAYKQLVQAGNGDQAATQMTNLITSAKLTDGQLTNMINNMDDYKHALTVALNNEGLKATNANLRAMAREGLTEVKDSASELAGVTHDALTGTFDGVDQDAMDFLSTLSNISSGMVDFRGAYQDTLDSVNEKGKEAWVKAHKNLSDYVDVAKASLPDYFATIDKMIAETQTHMGNVAAIVLALGPQYAEAAGQLGGDILQGIVDGMNKGNMDPLNTFKRQVDQGGKDAMDLINANIANATPAIEAEWMRLTGKTAQDFQDAMTKSGKSLDTLMNEARTQGNQGVNINIKANTAPAMKDFDNTQAYAEAMQIWLTAQGDVFPAKTDFANEREYEEGVKLWLHAHGDTVPARADFIDAKTWGEALTVWLHANGQTKPARDMFLSAKDYGDALTAWIQANADTWRAEQQLALVANKTRYATIQAIVANPGGRPINLGQAGYDNAPTKATGGAIYGPGTGTSDTAGLFRLSNGEHVLTAREVSALGGQAAVYDLRAQIRAGIAGRAGGGEVSSARYFATAIASQHSTLGTGTPRVQMVELSARDRALLARIPDGLQIRIGNDTISRANNASNLNSGTRGTN